MPETYTITLNAEQWQAVTAGVVELSYRVAQPILAEIQKQIQEQQKSKAKKEPKVKGKPDGAK